MTAWAAQWGAGPGCLPFCLQEVNAARRHARDPGWTNWVPAEHQTNHVPTVLGGAQYHPHRAGGTHLCLYRFWNKVAPSKPGANLNCSPTCTESLMAVCALWATRGTLSQGDKQKNRKIYCMRVFASAIKTANAGNNSGFHRFSTPIRRSPTVVKF